jgi:hypothetical protein
MCHCIVWYRGIMFHRNLLPPTSGWRIERTEDDGIKFLWNTGIIHPSKVSHSLRVQTLEDEMTIPTQSWYQIWWKLSNSLKNYWDTCKMHVCMSTDILRDNKHILSSQNNFHYIMVDICHSGLLKELNNLKGVLRS